MEVACENSLFVPIIGWNSLESKQFVIVVIDNKYCLTTCFESSVIHTAASMNIVHSNCKNNLYYYSIGNHN